MEPFSTQGNLDLLKRAGFVDVTTVVTDICFKGFLQLNNMNKDLLNEFLKIDLHQRINLSMMKNTEKL